MLDLCKDLCRERGDVEFDLSYNEREFLFQLHTRNSLRWRSICRNMRENFFFNYKTEFSDMDYAYGSSENGHANGTAFSDVTYAYDSSESIQIRIIILPVDRRLQEMSA